LPAPLTTSLCYHELLLLSNDLVIFLQLFVLILKVSIIWYTNIDLYILLYFKKDYQGNLTSAKPIDADGRLLDYFLASESVILSEAAEYA